jgi:hypothetical protein
MPGVCGWGDEGISAGRPGQVREESSGRAWYYGMGQWRHKHGILESAETKMRGQSKFSGQSQASVGRGHDRPPKPNDARLTSSLGRRSAGARDTAPAPAPAPAHHSPHSTRSDGWHADGWRQPDRSCPRRLAAAALGPCIHGAIACCYSLLGALGVNQGLASRRISRPRPRQSRRRGGHGSPRPKLANRASEARGG